MLHATHSYYIYIHRIQLFGNKNKTQINITLKFNHISVDIEIQDVHNGCYWFNNEC